MWYLTFVIYHDNKNVCWKSTFNNTSCKLKEQYEWINKFSNILPLPITTISFDNIDDKPYMYDMEYKVKGNSISNVWGIYTSNSTEENHGWF